MRISHTCRRIVSAAASVVMTAVLLVPLAAPVSAATVTVGKTLTTKEGSNAYRGETADLATSGLKTISIYVTAEAEGKKEVALSYGFGIGLAKDPWWIEMDHGKFTQTPADETDTGTSIKIPANESTPIKIDVSSLNVKYETGQYAGEYEFRNYYCEGTLTVDKIVPNDSGSSSSDPGGSSGTKGDSYTFTDNKDGTATLITTLTGSLDELDALLTAGYDEETYLEDGVSTWEEGDPINSRKMTYGEFGLPKPSDNMKVTPQSFTFAVESDIAMDTLMYGCGLNVEYKSPADIEYWLNVEDDPDTTKGYWYNEHGEDEDGNPTIDPDLVEVEVGTGTRLEDCGGWAEVTWEVPEDIKEYVTAQPMDAISFQFWYGDNKEDGYTPLESVTLQSATCTYTVETTFPYSGEETVEVSESLTQGDDDTNTASIPFKDFDLAEGDKVHAVIFDVTCPTTIKKMVFGVTVSDKASAEQYTQLQYCVLEAGKSTQIAIPIPSEVDPDVMYGNLGFGYYYGADAKDKLVNSITLNSVKVIYEDVPEVTTTTTTTKTTTTTTTTTTVTKPVEADWGNANCVDEVDVADAVLVARFAAEDTTAKISAQGKINADVTHDNNINGDDTILILRYIAKLVSYEDLEP